MFRKIGFPALALAAILAVVRPHPAEAKVRVGVFFGAPGYYVAPYAYPYGYGYPGYGLYPYPYAFGPTYVTPFVFGFGGHGGHFHGHSDGGHFGRRH